MYLGNELVHFVGKSLQDSVVVKLLNDMGHSKPITKPKRGEKDINIEHFEKGIGLVFQLAETLPDAYGGKFAEGELVLHTIFFRPAKDPSAAIYSDLPFGLRFSMSRADGRGMMGEPEWVSSFEAADRWLVDNRKIHIVFLEDESAVEDIAVFLPD